MEFSLLAQATTAVLLVLTTLFTYLQVKKRRSTTSIGSRGGQRAPEPPGAWPVIGHLPLLASFTQPHRAFTSLAKRFGPAYIIRMGLRPYLIVSTRETAKECYTVNDHAFATRPSTIAGKLMAYDHSVMGFTPNGAYWREARKIATTELYSARRIESLHAVRSSEVQSWVNNVYARGEEKERTVEVEMKGEMEELMFNVLMRMVSGKRYFGASVAREDEEMARRFKGAVKKFNHYLGNTEVYDALPFLEWVDFRGDARE
ncbi:Cytochrome P450 82C2 [Acorus calamus]|uniref:Cytochrome P450 82C2 n=1 Tax=Acorus calamus TaxID=4465 RepID=A0AAV9EI85_ACOCL|nr:Cytochrome P450 82C2 [Acorus calamus]